MHSDEVPSNIEEQKTAVDGPPRQTPNGKAPFGPNQERLSAKPQTGSLMSIQAIVLLTLLIGFAGCGGIGMFFSWVEERENARVKAKGDNQEAEQPRLPGSGSIGNTENDLLRKEIAALNKKLEGLNRKGEPEVAKGSFQLVYYCWLKGKLYVQDSGESDQAFANRTTVTRAYMPTLAGSVSADPAELREEIQERKFATQKGYELSVLGDVKIRLEADVKTRETRVMSLLRQAQTDKRRGPTFAGATGSGEGERGLERGHAAAAAVELTKQVSSASQGCFRDGGVKGFQTELIGVSAVTCRTAGRDAA